MNDAERKLENCFERVALIARRAKQRRVPTDIDRIIRALETEKGIAVQILLEATINGFRDPR